MSGYEPEKVKWCQYEYDFHMCELMNRTGDYSKDALEVVRCQEDLEKPVFSK